MKFVLLSDAKSVLQALNIQGYQKFPKVNQLLAEVESVSDRLVLQWIPGHCHIKGNEKADSLAKEGSAMNKSRWTCLEKNSKPKSGLQSTKDGFKITKITLKPMHIYYSLNREGQTIILRLRSGHNRLNAELRQRTWPKPSTLDDKLNGTEYNLTQTVEFIKATGLQI